MIAIDWVQRAVTGALVSRPDRPPGTWLRGTNQRRGDYFRVKAALYGELAKKHREPH